MISNELPAHSTPPTENWLTQNQDVWWDGGQNKTPASFWLNAAAVDFLPHMVDAHMVDLEPTVPRTHEFP